ncbi:ataxin-3-like [Chrysoperla carnea]|uniref:ataxin-3-like n=1 Tax=Chrysoperla carnea TaxID=189513 RepID=UPI001D08B9F7|nr:ataxin-3-like [Chrysoperla carnea]
METIFHEKQEGSLCAQHCLNALLQGPYFTPVDLGTLAQQMDDEERMRMAENGEESEEYRTFLAQPSGNMDDSGYFSVQVISSALKVWGLELVPYTSTEDRAKEAFKCPSSMQAFICHYRDHWFTVRRLGKQWFNLNSLLTSPEPISDTYLAMFLAQLQQEGYSIFVVFGELPECEADHILSYTPVHSIKSTTTAPSQDSKQVAISQEDKDFQQALLMSLEGNKQIPSTSSLISTYNDPELEKALSLSLDENENSSDEETQLRKAISMSLECKTPSKPATPCADPDEVRQKRLAFLNQITSTSSTSTSKPT